MTANIYRVLVCVRPFSNVVCVNTCAYVHIHIYVQTYEHVPDTRIHACAYIVTQLQEEPSEEGTMIILLQIRKQRRDVICPDS